jgi:hypothetical protein
MKARLFLAATLILALAVGTANANPMKFEGTKTATGQNFYKDENGNNQVKRHHRHHRRHHHHPMNHQ